MHPEARARHPLDLREIASFLGQIAFRDRHFVSFLAAIARPSPRTACFLTASACFLTRLACFLSQIAGRTVLSPADAADRLSKAADRLPKAVDRLKIVADRLPNATAGLPPAADRPPRPADRGISAARGRSNVTSAAPQGACTLSAPLVARRPPFTRTMCPLWLRTTSTASDRSRLTATSDASPPMAGPLRSPTATWTFCSSSPATPASSSPRKR